MTKPRAGAGANLAMGAGAEAEVIRGIIARLGSRATGIGDDAAMLRIPRGDVFVASVDTAIEGRHFERSWISPRDVGYRAVAAALSDLAAMAAVPSGVLIALALPDGWRPVLEEITEGIAEAVGTADTVVLGGNMSASSELSITTTVLGHAFHPVERSGARVGDALYVTGTLGGPGRAVAAWKRGTVPSPPDLERFVRPAPRLAEARWLAERGITAAIDISDGLAADLGHVVAASAVGAEIDLDRIPAIAGASPVDAARGGEEYELLVAGPRELEVAEFEARFALRLTRVGHVVEGPPRVTMRSRGIAVDVSGGYDHFDV